MRLNMPVTLNERIFRDEDGLISKTDLHGRITFVNDTFVYVSGYSLKELVGQTHNIVRHPDVPAEAFADLWHTIEAEKPWTSLIKNRCKNGDFYWVEANVTPLRQGNDITGYISIQSKPSREQIALAESNYRDIKMGKLAFKEGKATSKKKAGSILALNNFSIKMRLGIAVTMPCLLILIFGLVAMSGVTTQYPVFYMMALGLFAVGSLTTGFFIIHSVTRPLQEVFKAVARAASGDFSHSLQVSSNDEMGRILELINILNRNVQRIICNIYKSTDIVASTSQEIMQGNTDLNRRTEDQAANLEKTAASLKELTASVKANVANVKQASQLGSQASSIALKGGQDMNQVVQTMNAIHECSNRIVNIITVIDEIAFQTNILALNAAIEAARAGEHGRSFAVVAMEVRMLAQRSAAAAKEITALINDSVKKVENGSHLVDKAGKTIVGTVNSVNKVSEIMTQITIASQEQSAGIELINNAVTQLDGVTHQNAVLVEEAAVATEIMEAQIRNLIQAITVLNLGDTPTKPITNERRNQIKKYAAVKVQQKMARHRESYASNIKHLPDRNRIKERNKIDAKSVSG